MLLFLNFDFSILMSSNKQLFELTHHTKETHSMKCKLDYDLGNIGCLPFAKNSGNGKTNLVFANEKFPGKTGFLKVDQNSQTEFPNGNCSFHFLFLTTFRLGSLGYTELAIQLK